MFVEQPLALPGSAKDMCHRLTNCLLYGSSGVLLSLERMGVITVIYWISGTQPEIGPKLQPERTLTLFGRYSHLIKSILMYFIFHFFHRVGIEDN